MAINRNQPHQHLCNRISAYSKKARESRQVCSRLKKLLPERLKSLRSKYRETLGYSAAERQALLDPEYISFIEEYVDLHNNSLEARIQWESHMMLFEARRSLRAFHR